MFASSQSRCFRPISTGTTAKNTTDVTIPMTAATASVLDLPAHNHARELVARQHDHRALHAQPIRQRCLEIVRGGRHGSEYDVTALDVSGDIGPADEFGRRAQIGHGDPVAAADVDPAQERDVGWHRCPL